VNAVPPRILVAGGVSVVALLVLFGAWVLGREDATPATTTTEAVTTTTSVAPTESIAPTPITVLPDWYRKVSSRYDQRRPSTVPPGPTVTTTTTTTTSVPSDDSGNSGSSGKSDNSGSSGSSDSSSGD